MLKLQASGATKQEQFRFLTALKRLKMDEDFDLLFNFLKRELNRIDKENRKSLNHEQGWLQGSAQCLESLIGLIESSDSMAAKIKDLAESQGTQ